MDTFSSIFQIIALFLSSLQQRDGCTQQCSTFEDCASQCFPQLPPEAQEHSHLSREESQAPVIRQYACDTTFSATNYKNSVDENPNHQEGFQLSGQIPNIKGRPNHPRRSTWENPNTMVPKKTEKNTFSKLIVASKLFSDSCAHREYGPSSSRNIW